MKKIALSFFTSAILMFVLFINPVRAVDLPNVASLSLGQTRADVEKDLGKPLTVTERDGLIIDWYSSVAPQFADFAYFKDDRLVMKSTSTYSGTQTLVEFFQKYGQPDESIAKYAQDVQDSLQTTVHIWAQSGEAVQTIGTDSNSRVVRVMIFSPLSLDSFFQVLGKDLLGHEVISVKTIAPENLSNANTSTNQMTVEVEDSSFNVWLSLAAGVAIIIGLFITIRLLRRKTEQKTS